MAPKPPISRTKKVVGPPAPRGPRGKSGPGGTKDRKPTPGLLGTVRRSQLVGTYGPGAILDLRAPFTGAAISALLASLEEWDRSTPTKGLNHPQSFHEPRLEQELRVNGFRAPPAQLSDQDNENLPLVRFPQWLQCPRCDRIDHAHRWGSEPGKPERWCGAHPESQERVYVAPVRFIVACEEGHLDEFPWKYWCHCTCATPKLKLESKGPGLAGLRVSCINKDCQGKEESLDGIFSKEALVRRGVTCRGRHPWVTGDSMGPCSADRKTNPRVLQRGAASVYWAQTVSSLDIPPFSIDIAAELGKNWEDFKGKTEAEWLQLLELLNLPRKTNKPASVLLQLLREWRNASNVAEDVPFEYAEYQQLLKAHQQPVDEGAFQAESEPTPADFSAFLSGVVAAKRLREVRALEGFTRIHPPGGPFRKIRQRLQPLFHDSNEGIDWRPAVELRGEGIFLFLRDKRLREWEDDAQVQARVRDRIIRIGADLRLGEPHPADVDGLNEDERQRRFSRMLLLHSLSHALMRQIALECGYGSSALRERLYVGVGTYDMAGVLIHTGSPDSEGTLGGLVREARPDLFGPLLRAALESQVWCSSDPLCITGAATLSSPRNGAACHACLLAPETSCTHFNVLLDRALLVGSDEQPELGYFRKIVP